MSLWHLLDLACLEGERSMAKRTVAGGKRKRRCQVRPLNQCPSDGHVVSNPDNLKTYSSFHSLCAAEDLLAETNDSGVLYVNPQTPNWSLVERFAELSPGELVEIPVKQDHNGAMSSCSKHAETKKMYDHNGRSGTLKDKEKNSVQFLTRQTKDSNQQRRANVHKADAEENSQHEDGKGTKNKLTKSSSANTLSKLCKDVPQLLAVMKRRSALDSEDRPFKCTHCHWAFKKLCNLQSHLQTHSGLKPHVCDICGKAYSHQGTLQQHKHLHTGERPYHCPFCDKTYIWSSDYRKHIRTHTGEKPYICETCGKDFIRSSDLRKHERNIHTNNKPFPCTHCGKTFNKPLSLKRHERKHLGERPFSCPDCGKTFALASRMAEHQKVHMGVRPFVCSVCSKCFTKSSNLTEHKAIHSGVRPYKCGDCGVAFAMASRLVRHQFIHNNQKPHSCPGCTKNFRHLTQLKLHQEQTCAERIFVCVVCDKSFQCATNLAQHVAEHKEKKL